MKKQQIVALLLCIASCLTTIGQTNTNKWITPKQTFLSKAVTNRLPIYLSTTWTASLILEGLNTYYPTIGHMIYGTPITISEKFVAQEIIKNNLHSTWLQKMAPFSIEKSKNIWSAIAGETFSNHNTLFVGENVLTQFKKIYLENLPFSTIDPKHQKELISALIMINQKYDEKLLVLTALVPPLTWFTIYALNCFTEKFGKQIKNRYVKKLIYMINECKKSFTIKSAISACILGTYILFQRYSIGMQAEEIVKRLQTNNI